MQVCAGLGRAGVRAYPPGGPCDWLREGRNVEEARDAHPRADLRENSAGGQSRGGRHRLDHQENRKTF